MEKRSRKAGRRHSLASRILAQFMVVIVTLTLIPFESLAAYAASTTSVKSIDSIQTEYEVDNGTSKDEIGLPSMLSVVLETVTSAEDAADGETVTSEETVEKSVSWGGDYDGDIAGQYVLTASFDDSSLSYSNMPTVYITVREAKTQGEEPGAQTGEDEGEDGEDDPDPAQGEGSGASGEGSEASGEGASESGEGFGASENDTADEEEEDSSTEESDNGITDPSTEAASEIEPEQDPNATEDPNKKVLKVTRADGDSVAVGNYDIRWNFKWANGGGGTSESYEYTNPETGEHDDSYLFYHPQTWQPQTATLLAEVTFSIEEETSQEVIPAGAVEIRIPASFFDGWDGVKADQIVTQVPLAPETNTQSNFNYRIEGDEIVMTNYSDISGNVYLAAEFGYRIKVLDVDGGMPDEDAAYAAGYEDPTYAVGATAGGSDIDRFCWNHDGEYLWKDYYKKENQTCSISIDTDKDGTIDFSSDGQSMSVAMMTRGGGYLRVKPQPDDYQGVYTAWKSTWGPKPADAAQYVYAIWDVNYGTLNNSADNQPYNVHVYYDETYPAITFGEGDDATVIYGEQVGTFMHTWVNTRGVPVSNSYSLWEHGTAWGGDGKQGYYTDIARTNTNNTGKNNFFTPFYSSRASVNHAINDYASYSGVAGYWGNANLPRSSSIVYNWGGDTAYRSPHYAALIRYPVAEILACAKEYDIDLENDGVQIYSQFTSTESWESGYEPDRVARGVARLFIVDRSGAAGTFSKTAPSSRIVNGGQTILSDGSDLEIAQVNGGTAVYYAYLLNYYGTAASNGAEGLVPQHLVMEEQQLMLSSAGASHPRGWQPEGAVAATYPTGDGDGNYFLSDDDYTLPRFDVIEFENMAGEYAAGAWTEAGLLPYAQYKPILVSVRYAHSDEYVPYCGVKKTSQTEQSYHGVTAYRWDGSYDEEGNAVLGSAISFASGHHIPLPDGVVGIRYEHDTSEQVLKFTVRCSVQVRLNATDKMKELVDADIASGKRTYLKNIANYSISDMGLDGNWEERASGESSLNGKSVAGDVIWELTAITNELSMEKTTYVPSETSAAQAEALSRDMEMGYVKLSAKNSAGIETNIVTTTDMEDPYKLIQGTFYELLPKGTSIRSGSVIGVYDESLSNMRIGVSTYNNLKPYQDLGQIASYSVGSNSSRRYFLGASDYSVSTEYIPELDQTLVKIDYSFADPRLNMCPDSTWHCNIDFFFIIENSAQNIRARGTNSMNFSAFESTLEGGKSASTSGTRISGRNLGNLAETAYNESSADIANLFLEQVGDNSGRAVCATSSLNWLTLTVLETGYSKTVAAPESLNGMPQSETFTADGGAVTVGNRYIYKLQLTNTPSARDDQIVFYDILESGIESESPEWEGKFNGVDVSLIEGTPSDESETGARCAPVVYYSTVSKDELGPVFEDHEAFDVDNNPDIWSSTAPADLSTVTAVAIDCRKATDGTDFRLGLKGTLVAFIHMIAPDEMAKNDDGTINVDAKTVNGSVLMHRPYSEVPGDVRPDPTPLLSYAKIALRDTAVKLVKDSDPKTGTEDARTIVNSDGTGTIVYRLTLRNTMPFDCDDIVVTDPIPEYLTFDKVTVKLNGSTKETEGDSTPGFSYTLADDGRSFTFNIDQQHPTVVETGDGGEETVVTNKDTEIFIYTTVDELIVNGDQVFVRDYDNTATLVSANGKDIDEDTETTYHRAETVLVEVEKEWDDDDNEHNMRPDSIVVTLKGKYVSGTDPETGDQTYEDLDLKDEEGNPIRITITEDDDWKGSFENLAKYYVDTEEADFETPTTWGEIIYSVEEEPIYDPDDTSDPKIPVYTPEYGEMTPVDETGHEFSVKVINHYSLVDIEGIKEWDDADNRDGFRPDSVEIILKADGEQIKTTTATKDSSWKWSFTKLPKYSIVTGDDGTQTEKEIKYDVDETQVPKYEEPEITKNDDGTYTVKNTYTPSPVAIQAIKEWDDDEDAFGVRPASVEFTLYASWMDGETEQKYVVTEDQDGEEIENPVAVSAANSWTAKWENLPQFQPGQSGKEITYSVEETQVNGYTTTIGDGTIKNTPNTLKLHVKKTWDQEILGAGQYVKSVTFTVQSSVKGEDNWEDVMYKGEVLTVTLEREGNTFVETDVEKLPECNADGESLEYRAVETGMTIQKGDGTPVELEVEDGRIGGYGVDEDHSGLNISEIKNVFLKGYLKVAKVWNDDNNRDGYRPDKLDVKITAQTDYFTYEKTITLSKDNAWGHDLEALELPVYDEAGNEISYTISEESTEKYDPSFVITANGVSAEPVESLTGDTVLAGDVITEDTYTNTHEPETTDISATKVWEDDENEYGERPDTIEFTLYRKYSDVAEEAVTEDEDGNEIKPLEVKEGEGGTWKAEWKNLPVFKTGMEGVEITYFVKETKINGIDVKEYYGYEIDENGLEVVNTPVRTSLKVKKTWDKDVESIANTVSAATFRVEKSIDGNSWETVKVKGEDLTVSIDRTNGGAFGQTEVLGLYAYDKENHPYTYRAVEVSITVNGSEVQVSGDKVGGYAVEETHTPGEDESGQPATAQDLSEIKNTLILGELAVEKEWTDSDDNNGVRPGSITVTLKAEANGVEITGIAKSTTLNAANEWKDDTTWKEVPVFDAAGNEVEYTFTEPTSGNYKAYVTVTSEEEGNTGASTINADAATTIKFRNELILTEFDVTKEFGEDLTGIINSKVKSIKVRIQRSLDDGQTWGEVIRKDGTNIVDLTEDNGWRYRWDDLPRYDSDGTLIQYRAIEVSITTVDDNTYNVVYGSDETEGVVTAYNYTSITTPAGDEPPAHTTLINTIIIGKLKAIKHWDDDNDRDNLRPEDITFHLFQNGVQLGQDFDKTLEGQKAVSENDDENYVLWENLPVYDVDGEDILYTYTEILGSEETNEDYTSEIDGTPAVLAENEILATTITNKHVPLTTKMYVKKVWEGNFIYGDHPESVDVYLYATYETGDSAEPTDPVAPTEPEDKRNADEQTDPAEQTTSGTVKELAAPEHEETSYDNPATLSKDNNWEYTWVDLPVYKTGYVGHKITYSVEEKPVPNGFEVEYAEEEELLETVGSVDVMTTNFTVTNTMKTTNLEVNKTWIDEDDAIAAKIKSVSFKVQRSADSGSSWTDLVNTETGDVVTLTIDKKESTASIDGLPTFSADGSAYLYRAVETGYTLKDGTIVEVEYAEDSEESGTVGAYNYRASTEGSREDGFVTNVENPMVRGAISVTKIWKNDSENNRPKSLKITLKTFAGDGEIKLKGIAYSTELSSSNDWTDGITWASVPVYDEYGNKIIYMLEEPSVDKYEASYKITYRGSEIESDKGTTFSTEVFEEGTVEGEFTNSYTTTPPPPNNTGDNAPIAAAGAAFAIGVAGLAAVLAKKRRRRS